MKRLLAIAAKHYHEDRLSVFFYRVLRALIAETAETMKWLRVKLFRLRYKDELVIRNIRGNKMGLSAKDKGISSGLIAHGYWEPLATNLLTQSIREGDIVLDIDANMGYFALQESRLVGKTGKVLAVEPVSANIEHLKRNIELNGVTNIDVYQFAVGDKNDEGSSIFLSAKLNCASMIYRSDELNLVEGAVKKLAVKLTTVDKFLEGKPTPCFMRMDVEGYEYEIMLGAKNLLAKGHPMKMLIELHPGYLGEKLGAMLDLLKQHGFVCEVAVDRQLDSKSQLLQNLFYYLSDRIDYPGKNGYFFRNTDLDTLKSSFASKPIYPHVLFARG